MNYHRLCPSEREQISRLLAVGTSLTAIAAHLGRNKSTISREVARIERTGRPYAAFDAQADADRKLRQRRSVRKLDAMPALLSIVTEKLALRWSPEQISAFA